MAGPTSTTSSIAAVSIIIWIIGSIIFAPDKKFWLDGTETIATASNIEGKKIVPYYHKGDYVLTDADTYTLTETLLTVSATYRKTLDGDRVGKYQAWLVPFDYTITDDDLQKFTFYKIDMIAHSPDPSQEASDKIWVYVKRMNEGDLLHANMPYVYKPKEAVTDYAFTTSNYPYLQPKNTGVIAKTETMEDIFKFYATYENTTATAQDPFYYVNIDGTISYGTSVTVGPLRWIVRMESKFGETPQAAYAREMVFFDGEEASGIETIDNGQLTIDSSWFTLDGRKLNGKPTKAGIYVNGGRKIVIK